MSLVVVGQMVTANYNLRFSFVICDGMEHSRCATCATTG
jgi:hypothetical protein